MLVVNKVNTSEHNLDLIPICVYQIDLAPYVGASLEVMDRDSKLMRGDGPTIFTSIKEKKGIDDVVGLILGAWRNAGSPGKVGPVGEEA